jgi:hypothetical protein
VQWRRLWTRFYQSIGVLSNGKNFDKGGGISIKVAVIIRIVVVIGEKWDSLETTLPFETTGGFIVTPGEWFHRGTAKSRRAVGPPESVPTLNDL